ncbi:MAG TPA: hypothetical protein VMV27_16165 [Candidatus Binataceae bacterium]|nr:hypothetical protein [Candidatus Binataceae bacterium]
MTSVLIIGGQGALGSIVADAMRERGDLAVLIGGRRAERRKDFRYVDLAKPETIAPALAGVDFAISTVADPQFELERVVVETGSRSINISSAVLPIGGHVSLRGRGLAIVHAGLAPLGLQALIAKALVGRYPEAARLEVAMCFSARGASGPQGREFAYAALTRLPFEHSREIGFSAPIGRRRCFSAALPEREILHALIPEGEAGVYVGFAEPIIHRALAALRATRLIRALPRSLFTGGAAKSAPAIATTEPMRQWVAVYDASGRRLAATVTEGEGDYRSTAIVTRAFLDAAIERLKTRKPFGVQSAERLFDLADLTAHLSADLRIRDLA